MIYNRIMRVWLVFSSIYIIGALFVGVILLSLVYPDANYVTRGEEEYVVMLVVGTFINYTCIATLNYIVRGKVTLWYKESKDL